MFKILAKVLVDIVKERQAAKKAAAYDTMITESQAKIGPYVPTPCPVQIWA